MSQVRFQGEFSVTARISVQQTHLPGKDGCDQIKTAKLEHLASLFSGRILGDRTYNCSGDSLSR